MSRRRQRTVPYSTCDYVDMFMCYASADGNSAEAQRNYEAKYPDRKLPDESVFEAVAYKLRTTGGVHGMLDDDPTRPIDEQICYQYQQNPTIHMRTVAERVNVSLWKVWRTVYERVPKNTGKTLNNEQYNRKQFCQFLFEADLEHANFFPSILWTGEATFGNEGILNLHTQSTSKKTSKKPSTSKAKSTTPTLQGISVKVLMGIANDHLFGPYFLPDDLDDNKYTEFIKELIEDLPLQIRNNIIYQNEGGSKYFGRTVKAFINVKFFNKWIGKNGPIPWPKDSPALTPIQYHIWPKMSSLVYNVSPITTVDELKGRISNAAEEIRKGLTKKVVNYEMRERVKLCIRLKGKLNDEQMMNKSSPSE